MLIVAVILAASPAAFVVLRASLGGNTIPSAALRLFAVPAGITVMAAVAQIQLVAVTVLSSAVATTGSARPWIIVASAASALAVLVTAWAVGRNLKAPDAVTSGSDRTPGIVQSLSL